MRWLRNLNEPGYWTTQDDARRRLAACGMAGPASPVCTAPSRTRRPAKLVPLNLADACGPGQTKGQRSWIMRPRPSGCRR
jgi:hypothetical protein